MNSVNRRSFIFSLDSVVISVGIENSGCGIVGDCSLDGLEFDGSWTLILEESGNDTFDTFERVVERLDMRGFESRRCHVFISGNQCAHAGGH